MNNSDSEFTPEDPPTTPADHSAKIQKVQRTRSTREGKRSGSTPNIGFVQAVSLAFQNFFTFRGRATRSEYWYFHLFSGITYAAFLVAGLSLGIDGGTLETLVNLIGLIFFFPQLSVSIRRLHDINRSGWWWWLVWVPCVGVIVLLVWNCTEGTRGPNDYGPPRSETI